MTNAGEFFKAYMAYVDQQDKAVIALLLLTLGILSTWLISSLMEKKETGFVRYLFWAYTFTMPYFSILAYLIFCIYLWGSL